MKNANFGWIQNIYLKKDSIPEKEVEKWISCMSRKTKIPKYFISFTIHIQSSSANIIFVL